MHRSLCQPQVHMYRLWIATLLYRTLHPIHWAVSLLSTTLKLKAITMSGPIVCCSIHPIPPLYSNYLLKCKALLSGVYPWCIEWMVSDNIPAMDVYGHSGSVPPLHVPPPPLYSQGRSPLYRCFESRHMATLVIKRGEWLTSQGDSGFMGFKVAI